MTGVRIIALSSAIVLVVISTLIFVPNIIPVSVYKGHLQEWASAAVGRKVTFNDDISMKLIPRTEFRVKELVVTSADGFDGEYLVKAPEAIIAIEPLSYFSGRITTRGLTFVNPHFNFIRTADANNWTLGHDKAGVKYYAPSNVRSGDLRIVGGRVDYEDRVKRHSYSARNMSLRVVPASDTEILEVEGDTEILDHRFSIVGKASVDGAKVEFFALEMQLDDINMRGTLSLNVSGPRPKAGGVLFSERFDLRPYLHFSQKNEMAEGFPAWSNQPVNFNFFHDIDANFEISTRAVLLEELEFGESRLKITIDAGKIVAEVRELTMYQGKGVGVFAFAANENMFSGKFEMSDLQSQPFSADLLKRESVTGLSSFKFEFATTGASQAAMVSSLDGVGEVAIVGGRIIGVNLRELAIGFDSAIQSSSGPERKKTWELSESAAIGKNKSTEFDHLSIRFAIQEGVARAQPISLVGPSLNLSGSSVINLSEQTIDLKLPFRLSRVEEGKPDIDLPLRSNGTFSELSIEIDYETLLRDKLESDLRGVLDKALNAESEKEAAGQDADPTRDLLRGILGEEKTATTGEGASDKKDDPSRSPATGANGKLFESKPPASAENAEAEL